MDSAPYLVVFCLHTGKPWSEEPKGKEFRTWMEERFKTQCEWNIPPYEQDYEFCCAHPTRSGSNSMVKGPFRSDSASS